jgi:hypothetical protein
MAIHSGGAAGLEHPRRDVVSVQRQTQSVGQRLRPIPVKYGERDERVIGAVLRHRRVPHMQASSHLVGDSAEHFGRGDATRYQCCDPPQGGLLIG